MTTTTEQVRTTSPRGWRELAACKKLNWKIFFPRKGNQADKAKKICAGCPVKTECLADALLMTEQVGVYGGMTASERRRLKNAK